MRKNRTRVPERTERRISAATSLTMCAVTVIAQIATTLLLTHFLREKANYVYAVLEFVGAVAALRVYLRPGSPSYKLAWMCLLLALPVSGMILFCLWGGHPSGQEPEPADGAPHQGAGERPDGKRKQHCPSAQAVSRVGAPCHIS